MTDTASSQVFHSMLAYALHSRQPDSANAVRFGRLVGLRGPLGGLTAACFLLHRPRLKNRSTPEGRQDRDGPCVHRLLFHTAPILLQQLSRTTQPQRVALNGRIRGRVDWANTYKARYAEDNNPGVFVCLQSWRRFDQPENQLFKFLLRQIRLCLDLVPPELRVWRAWGPRLRTEEGEPLHLGSYFAQVDHRVRKFGAHVYLREVALPGSIGGQHLLAARTSKNSLYGEVAELYDLYQSLVGAPEWKAWQKMLRQTLPLPPTADQVGRLWAPAPPRPPKR